MKEDVILLLAKIERVFMEYPQFFRYEYFAAPYKVYSTDEYFTLKFYASQKGVTTCVAYFKNLRESSPDAQEDIIKDGIRFVVDFCLSKKIELDNYINYKSVSQPDFLMHIKQYKISFFLAFALPGCYYALSNMEEDEQELYFGPTDINDLYIRYEQSNIRQWLEKKIPDIKKFIKTKNSAIK
jgi:hypothetical protein